MSDPAGKLDMTGDEALSSLNQIKELNDKLFRARLVATDKANAAKEAKAYVQLIQDELSELITKSTEDIKDRPLFGGGDKSPEGESTDKVVADIQDIWHDEPISVLLDHGCTQKQIDNLLDGGVLKLGDLAGVPDLTAIKGIGKAAAEKIKAAADSYHDSKTEGGEDAEESESDIVGDEPDDDPEGEPSLGPLSSFLVTFTRARAKRAVVYAASKEQALDWALVNLQFVDSVMPIAKGAIKQGKDEIHEVPEGYGTEEQDDTDEPDEVDELILEPDDDNDPDYDFDDDDPDDNGTFIDED